MTETSTEVSFESVNFNENGALKLKFAEAFSSAMVANKDLRRLIKEESLKKFDKDFDVLYVLIKDKSLIPANYYENTKYSNTTNLFEKSSNALTLRGALLPFFNSEAELIEIEQKLPLLTIFVPELPLNSFSAETWDVNDEEQIPDVALRLDNTNDVPVIGKTGNKYVIEAGLTPGFPIIVIKENERVRIKSNISKVNKNAKLSQYDNSYFEFLDDNFDPNSSYNNTSIPTANGLDQFLIDSYNVWNGYASGGWQRDYIYYGLTPTNTTGTFNGGKYKEQITSFKLSGNDPILAFNYISNIEDPKQVTDYRAGSSSGWTDGNFEFIIYSYYGSKDTDVGSSDKKGFSAKPSDLFEMKYESYSRFNWPFKKTYIKTTIISTKTINFLNYNYGIVLEFRTWDLNKFANDWKFEFEEVDDPLEITNVLSESHKFNTNFELNSAAGGLLEKVGLKLGASSEQSKSNSYTIKKSTKSNNLFTVFVPFYDNVVNKDQNTGQIIPRSYNTGKVEFVLRPVQVQW